MTDKPIIILASQSERRREILEKFSIKFDVVVPTDEEISPDGNLTPEKFVHVNSLRKCESVAAKFMKNIENAIIIACDTIAAYNNKIIGKPDSIGDAKRILQMLSGTKHQVISGITVIKTPENKRFTTVDITQINMLSMTDEEIDAYVNSGEAFGKAGAYAIQETGDRFVKITQGSFYNVVGLPIEKLLKILKTFGIFVEHQ